MGWYEDGDEEKDGKYVGEIEYRKPNGQGTHTVLGLEQNTTKTGKSLESG